MSNDLNRHLAPLSPAVWSEIEDEAKKTLQVLLAGRKLVDFTGPLGWAESAVPTGHVTELSGTLADEVRTRQRVVQPMIELRAAFTLDREEMHTIDRGNPAPDLDPVIQAAKRMAIAEDRMIFDGFGAGNVRGMMAHAGNEVLKIPDDYLAYPNTVSLAVETLRGQGVGGPYAVALGPRCYRGLMTTATAGGYPAIEHVRRVVDGPIVSAPAIDGALVLSLRGGDFELVVGRDLSIGYLGHSATQVQLYLEESLLFRLHTPEAAVPLRY